VDKKNSRLHPVVFDDLAAKVDFTNKTTKSHNDLPQEHLVGTVDHDQMSLEFFLQSTINENI
jgi:hypothetical protein